MMITIGVGNNLTNGILSTIAGHDSFRQVVVGLKNCLQDG